MMNNFIKIVIFIFCTNNLMASTIEIKNKNLLWQKISTAKYNDDKLKCSNGSYYNFYYKKGNENLIIFFSAGGACWDFETCNSHNKEYNVKTYENKTNLKYNKPGYWKGLLDINNIKNPIKDWSILFLPYCTGDLHIGNNIKEYIKGNNSLKIYHNGYNNVKFAINWMVNKKLNNFNKMIVSGSSSGGYGAIFNFDLIKNKIKAKNYMVITDASDGVVSSKFIEHAFKKNNSSWNPTIALEKTINKNYFIIDYFIDIIKRNKNTQFLAYSSEWDIMQILFYNIMKEKPKNWLLLNDNIKREWRQNANKHKKKLLKYDNFYLRNNSGCKHSGLRYDDVFYNKNSSINEWLNTFEGIYKEKNIPSDEEFNKCFNRAIQSVKE